MITRIKNLIVTSIKNKKLNVFLLFLFSSFLILIFVKLSKEYTNTLVFNIKNTNVPEDIVILNNGPKRLKVTLKTHGFKWLQYYFSNPKINIDFKEDVYKKKNTYVYITRPSLLNETKQFQNQIKIISINPDTLHFKFDVNLIKKLPVIPNTEVSFALGFDVLDAYYTKPDSITVIGPHQIVENINSISTVKTNLENVKANINKQVALVLPKNKDLKFSNQHVFLKANVEKFTEGILNIPIKITNLPKETLINFFPKTLKVSYYTSLSNFNTITAKDFKVICDFNKVENSTSFMIPELVKYPDNVKFLKLSQTHIEFIITK